MALPDWLASRKGRLAAFFLLYVTEGLPLGFVVTAVATQLRRMGVGPADIGALVAAFYLPWAFKWATGPLVDVFRSQRFGHRRAWILGTQAMMEGAIFGPKPGMERARATSWSRLAVTTAWRIWAAMAC